MIPAFAPFVSSMPLLLLLKIELWEIRLKLVPAPSIFIPEPLLNAIVF
jgi:hypothetical protein